MLIDGNPHYESDEQLSYHVWR